MDNLMKAQEAARYMGISLSLFYRLKAQGYVKPLNANPMKLRQNDAVYSATHLDTAKTEIAQARHEAKAQKRSA